MTTDQKTEATYTFTSAATLYWKTDENGKVLSVEVTPHYDTHEVYEAPEDESARDAHDVLVAADDRAWAFPDEMFAYGGEQVILGWSC